MRLLADQCCARVVVLALREAGHDVVWIQETHPGLPDPEVAAMAQALCRVIVTDDYDFGELAIRRASANAGVVLVACPSLPLDDRAKRVVEVIASESSPVARISRSSTLNACAGGPCRQVFRLGDCCAI